MTEARIAVDVALLLDLLILLLFAFVLDLQLFARLVQHVFQALVDGRLARLAPGLRAKP